MTKTLFDVLTMLQAADCAGPWVENRAASTRTEISSSPRGEGRMILRVCHQSSGVLASAQIEPDYTISDDQFEMLERDIGALGAG